MQGSLFRQIETKYIFQPWIKRKIELQNKTYLICKQTFRTNMQNSKIKKHPTFVLSKHRDLSNNFFEFFRSFFDTNKLFTKIYIILLTKQNKIPNRTNDLYQIKTVDAKRVIFSDLFLFTSKSGAQNYIRICFQ